MKANFGGWTAQALEVVGADIDGLIEHLPKQMAVFVSEPELATLDDINAILMEAERQTGNPHIGLHISRQTDLSKLGLYGYLLHNAQTLREFLEISERYYSTLLRNAMVTVSIKGDIATLEYKPLMHSRISSRHDNECTLGFFVNVMRGKLGDGWHPLKTSFASGAPDDLTELSEVFGPNVQFDQPTSKITLTSDLLSIPVCDAGTDTGLLAIVREKADTLLRSYSQENAFECNVRLLIMKTLEDKTATASDIARELGMSLSTFKRRLNECHRSFRGLKEDLIVTLGKQALAETDSRISNIALMLGYSELSAFDRAFLKFEGIAPSAYRKKAKAGR